MIFDRDENPQTRIELAAYQGEPRFLILKIKAESGQHLKAGTISGLELSARALGSGSPFVDLSVAPGLALDPFSDGAFHNFEIKIEATGNPGTTPEVKLSVE